MRSPCWACTAYLSNCRTCATYKQAGFVHERRAKVVYTANVDEIPRPVAPINGLTHAFGWNQRHSIVRHAGRRARRLHRG